MIQHDVVRAVFGILSGILSVLCGCSSLPIRATDYAQSCEHDTECTLVAEYDRRLGWCCDCEPTLAAIRTSEFGSYERRMKNAVNNECRVDCSTCGANARPAALAACVDRQCRAMPLRARDEAEAPPPPPSIPEALGVADLSCALAYVDVPFPLPDSMIVERVLRGESFDSQDDRLRRRIVEIALAAPVGLPVARLSGAAAYLVGIRVGKEAATGVHVTEFPHPVIHGLIQQRPDAQHEVLVEWGEPAKPDGRVTFPASACVFPNENLGDAIQP